VSGEVKHVELRPVVMPRVGLPGDVLAQLDDVKARPDGTYAVWYEFEMNPSMSLRVRNGDEPRRFESSRVVAVSVDLLTWYQQILNQWSAFQHAIIRAPSVHEFPPGDPTMDSFFLDKRFGE